MDGARISLYKEEEEEEEAAADSIIVEENKFVLLCCTADVSEEHLAQTSVRRSTKETSGCLQLVV